MCWQLHKMRAWWSLFLLYHLHKYRLIPVVHEENLCAGVAFADWICMFPLLSPFVHKYSMLGWTVCYTSAGFGRSQDNCELFPSIPSWWGGTIWHNCCLSGNICEKLCRLLCNYVHPWCWWQVGTHTNCFFAATKHHWFWCHTAMASTVLLLIVIWCQVMLSLKI